MIHSISMILGVLIPWKKIKIRNILRPYVFAYQYNHIYIHIYVAVNHRYLQEQNELLNFK